MIQGHFNTSDYQTESYVCMDNLETLYLDESEFLTMGVEILNLFLIVCMCVFPNLLLF